MNADMGSNQFERSANGDRIQDIENSVQLYPYCIYIGPV